MNRRLELAFQILEDETCQSCGLPSWLTHSADNRVMFDVFVTRCHGCKAREDAEDKRTLKGHESFVVKHVDTIEDHPERGDELESLPSRAESLRMQEELEPVIEGLKGY